MFSSPFGRKPAKPVPAPDEKRVAAILEALEEAIQSEDFIRQQDEFVDQNGSLFTEAGDLPPQCMEIYQKYIHLIEASLLSKVRESVSGFSFEELIPIISRSSDDDFAHGDVFELLRATTDFNEFRGLMVSYNKGQNISLEITTTRI